MFNLCVSVLSRLKRYVGGKEALEAELYSRFVLVLNEKKAKIRSLQQEVTNLQEMKCVAYTTSTPWFYNSSIRH